MGGVDPVWPPLAPAPPDEKSKVKGDRQLSPGSGLAPETHIHADWSDLDGDDMSVSLYLSFTQQFAFLSLHPRLKTRVCEFPCYTHTQRPKSTDPFNSVKRFPQHRPKRSTFTLWRAAVEPDLPLQSLRAATSMHTHHKYVRHSHHIKFQQQTARWRQYDGMKMQILKSKSAVRSTLKCVSLYL